MLTNEIKRIPQYFNGLYKDFLERGTSPKYPLTSLPRFNRKIWGLKEGLTLIASRTSQGKSSLSLQFAYDLAKQGIPTLFLSLEMLVPALIERLFCNVKEVDNYALLTGQFAILEEIEEKWDEFKKEMEALPILITDKIGHTFSEINKLIEIMNPAPKAVFIDHLQEIRVGSKNEREMMDEYIRSFKELALKKGFAGVLCSQINRTASTESKDHEPQLHQLKSTGGLEEKADTVILLHYPYFYDQISEKENKYKIIIAKQRNGRTGKYDCKFIPEYYKFKESDDLSQAPEEVKEVADIFGGGQ